MLNHEECEHTKVDPEAHQHVTILKITQVFFLEVDKDWYDPEILSGEGPVMDQIVEYEKNQILMGNCLWGTLKTGETTVEPFEVENAVPEQEHQT